MTSPCENIKEITAVLELPGSWTEKHLDLARLRVELARQIGEAEKLLRELPSPMSTEVCFARKR